MTRKRFSLLPRAAGRALSRAARSGCLALMLWPGAVAAQTSLPPLSPTNLPSLIRPHAEVMGDRLSKPGKERVVFSGVLTDASGDVPAQIILQQPVLCRLDKQGANAVSVGFDGAQGFAAQKSQTSADDEALLESFSDDSPEGFFNAAAGGAGLWLVGRRFRVQDSTTATTTPQWVDVYAVLRPVKQRKDRLLRQKMYHFDSNTRLLSRVVYQSSSGGPMVETIFEGWQSINGQAVPTVWKRREGGRVVFSFRTTGAVFSGGTADTTWTRPH